KLGVRGHRAPERLLRRRSGPGRRRSARRALATGAARSRFRRIAIPSHRHPVAAKSSRWWIAASERPLGLQMALVLQFVSEISNNAYVVDDVREAGVFGGIVLPFVRITQPDEPRVIAPNHLVTISEELLRELLHAYAERFRIQPARVDPSEA